MQHDRGLVTLRLLTQTAPVHLLPAWADLGYKAGDFPNAKIAASQELSLPMFPELTEAELNAVAEGVHSLTAAAVA